MPAELEGKDPTPTLAIVDNQTMWHRDVEPTNNGSEQKLRPSVIFRKVTNCFRSEWGAKLYADLCSIVSTGRLHGRSPLAAIREALTGRFKPA